MPIRSRRSASARAVPSAMARRSPSPVSLKTRVRWPLLSTASGWPWASRKESAVVVAAEGDVVVEEHLGAGAVADPDAGGARELRQHHLRPVDPPPAGGADAVAVGGEGPDVEPVEGDHDRARGPRGDEEVVVGDRRRSSGPPVVRGLSRSGRLHLAPASWLGVRRRTRAAGDCHVAAAVASTDGDVTRARPRPTPPPPGATTPRAARRRRGRPGRASGRAGGRAARGGRRPRPRR